MLSVIVSLALMELFEFGLTASFLAAEFGEISVKKLLNIFSHQEGWFVDFGKLIALIKVLVRGVANLDSHFGDIRPHVEIRHSKGTVDGYQNVTKRHILNFKEKVLTALRFLI